MSEFDRIAIGFFSRHDQNGDSRFRSYRRLIWKWCIASMANYHAPNDSFHFNLHSHAIGPVFDLVRFPLSSQLRWRFEAFGCDLVIIMMERTLPKGEEFPPRVLGRLTLKNHPFPVSEKVERALDQRNSAQFEICYQPGTVISRPRKLLSQTAQTPD